jgi:hypothetical protein
MLKRIVNFIVLYYPEILYFFMQSFPVNQIVVNKISKYY